MRPLITMSSISRLAAGVVCLIGSVACDNPAQPSSVAGVYLLRLGLACSGLPADITTRTYVARITENRVTLSGATFWMPAYNDVKNWFAIYVDGRDVRIKLDVVRHIHERTSPGKYFQVVGESHGTVTRARDGSRTIAGKLTAEIRYGENLADPAAHVRCDAAQADSTFQFTSYAGAVPPDSIVPGLVGLDLQGADIVTLQATTPLTLTGHFADGTKRDVTSEALWESSNGTVLGVAAGRVTGLSIGESTLKVTFTHPDNRTNLLRREVRMFVVPEGSFSFEGRVVTGPDEFTILLEGATVTVTAGSPSGFVAKSDRNGRFVLPGVLGPLTLVTTLPGYRTLTCAIPSVNSQQFWEVQLAPPPRNDTSCTRLR